MKRNRRTASICVAIALMGVVAVGCGRRNLRVYPDVAIRAEAVQRHAALPGLGTRHALESDSGVVLVVFTFDQGKWMTMDDEVCSTVLIAIPANAVKSTPTGIENPVAYLDTCSCTWPICREVASEGGTVTVRRATATGVQADINLRFPSRSIRVSGRFQRDSPSADLLLSAKP